MPIAIVVFVVPESIMNNDLFYLSFKVNEQVEGDDNPKRTGYRKRVSRLRPASGTHAQAPA